MADIYLSRLGRRRSSVGTRRFRLCALPNEEGMAGQAARFLEYWPSCRLGI